MKRMQLKLLRVKLNLTQQKMADSLGVSKATYAAIENGKRTPKMKFWYKLQNIYQIDDSEMFSLQKAENHADN